MNNNILCSFSDSDFFILEEDQNIKILNRQFNIIYSGPVANYIEDIGKGIIKIYMIMELTLYINPVK